MIRKKRTVNRGAARRVRMRAAAWSDDSIRGIRQWIARSDRLLASWQFMSGSWRRTRRRPRGEPTWASSATVGVAPLAHRSDLGRPNAH